jgi:Rod binding domain-containing protein
MAEYLEQAVERLTRDHYDNQPSVYFSKAGVAFREGMAQRIVERLRDRRWEQEREAKAQAEANKARASHPAYAGPTGNALTIVDVKRSEAEANQEFVYDLQYGTGAWAKAKAQRVALHAEWDRQAEEARLAQEAFKRDHPAEWAAEQARKQKEADAWAKREERNSRRRTGGRYYAPKGPRHADYYTGHAKGGDVSLDRQVSSRDDRKLS